jgi:uncharacterized membrane protein YeaQ/YmgE (transglycosylase-associated protein family)
LPDTPILDYAATRLPIGNGVQSVAQNYTIGSATVGVPFIELLLGRCRMSIIGWIILGLIAGFIASKIVNKEGQGLILDIVLGIVGAIVGGFIFDFFGASGVTGLNLYSMVVAIIGAIVVLVIYHAVRRAV